MKIVGNLLPAVRRMKIAIVYLNKVVLMSIVSNLLPTVRLMKIVSNLRPEVVLMIGIFSHTTQNMVRCLQRMDLLPKLLLMKIVRNRFVHNKRSVNSSRMNFNQNSCQV